MQIAGKATLDPTAILRVTPDAVATKLDILTAKGGIIGELPTAPKGCKLTLSADKTTLVLEKQ